MRLIFPQLTHLESMSVVIDIVRLPPVSDSLAGEGAVTETVGGRHHPELVDQRPATFVWGRSL